MSSTTSPYMNLIIPGVGTEAGPTYASDINSSLTLIDQHNHSAGSGVQIPPGGLNINSDLPVQSNNIIDVRTIRFTPQSAALGVATDIGCLYEAGAGGDLYYNDAAGNQVRLTQGGSIVGTAGSITGLPGVSGTASASYSAGTFTWQSATSTAANMDAASYIFRNNTASSFGVTLSAPSALANDYALTLPTLPGSTSFMTLDASGNMGAPTPYPLTTAGIANGQVTNAKLAAVTMAYSSNISANPVTQGVTVPNSTTSALTTSTRPVVIELIPLPNNTTSYINILGTSGQPTANVKIIANDGSTDYVILKTQIGSGNSGSGVSVGQGIGNISNQGTVYANPGGGGSVVGYPFGITAGANTGITASTINPTYNIPVSGIRTVINTPTNTFSPGNYTFRLLVDGYVSVTAVSIIGCQLIAYEL